MKQSTTHPLLSPADTLNFEKQLDLACRLLDSGFLQEVLERFELAGLPESREFLEEAPERFDSWKMQGKLVRVKEVADFPSRCIACSFGKKVKVNQIKYEVPYDEGFSVNFSSDFAVNLLIEHGQLMDFGWCNAFLDQEEMCRMLN